jgi:hypothetical protein
MDSLLEFIEFANGSKRQKYQREISRQRKQCDYYRDR